VTEQTGSLGNRRRSLVGVPTGGVGALESELSHGRASSFRQFGQRVGRELHGALRALRISRKTGYKWVARYEARGAEGLAERRPVARSCPHQTAPDVLHQVIELRKEHPKWGPKKLRARLEALGLEALPAASTIGDALKKHGLIRPRRRRVHPPMHRMPIAPTEHPNDTWCVDFKGHFAVGDKTRCYPLTLTDHTTRFLLKCEGLAKADEVAVRPHFERAFREFGLPM
jgi:putative transposase